MTKAITEMRFVHWCRVPWIIGADGSKSSRIDMQALDIENVLVFDSDTMEHVMKITPEETIRWQNVSRERFIVEYKTYIRKCVSMTSINTTKVKTSKRSPVIQEKQQAQLVSSQRQAQVLPTTKMTKSARQLTTPAASVTAQTELPQTVQTSVVEPPDSGKSICEFFFKKSDNSVILFKISFTDGYCK